jgi:hypothetical protein
MNNKRVGTGLFFPFRFTHYDAAGCAFVPSFEEKSGKLQVAGSTW